MNEQPHANLTAAKQAIVEVLRKRTQKALFVTELTASLRHANIGKDDLDEAISELVATGALIVRDNFCADPHLANVDLRVVATVDESAGDDGHAAALREIDLAWNKWLGEYLANHRCG